MVDVISKEERIIDFWRQNKIDDKVREKNRGKRKYYFLDGPPFVTGDLHPGQIWTKTMKDVAVRYKRYRGYDVVDRAGYDVHGLPIENRLEKDLGIQSKRDIEEKIGIEKFIDACRAYVEKYIGRMDADYYRFGISLDFGHPYLPYKNEYIETAWGMFKTASDNGFLYRGKRTLIYCPHCETPLSQGSMEVEYKDVDDPSIYLAFKIDEGRSKPKADLPKNSYLVIWTTTPWTIPANVAVAANPKKIYVAAKSSSGKSLILGKERIEAFSAATGESLTISKEFYGSELDGVCYTSPIEERVPKQKELRKYHKVVFSESLVSMGEGTGLVHMAPGHGIEDFSVGVKNKLPIFSPLNSDATYNDDAGAYKGLKVPLDANKAVEHDLEKSGAVLGKGSIRHSYPYCWRCSSKLIFLATDQWFMNVAKIKKKLIRQNERVSWHPDEVKGWQKAVIENSPDWCISRQRYWGIPAPIWLCDKCGKTKVIGSIHELKSSAVEKGWAESIRDLHRPHIDRIKLKCDCGGEMVRVKDVLDGWFDSGTTFRASLTEEQFKRLFPVDMVLEYVEQTRAWFQYLMKCGVMVYGKVPFKHVVVHGIMAGTDGRKMSKSFGNYRPLSELTKMYTADAFRLWCVDHQPILNRNLNESEIKDNEKVVIILHNISSLVQEYRELLNYKPRQGKRPSPRSISQIDAWLISRIESIAASVTAQFDAYESYKAASVLKNFIIEDFSRFYLKIAKKRMGTAKKREAKAILETIDYVLLKTLILLSVITPFSTEHIYKERFGGRESIFLEDWPKSASRLVNPSLEAEVGAAQEAITAILNSREKANLKLRWPASKATLELRDDKVLESIQRLSGMIEEYTNVKRLELKRVNAVKEEIVPLFGKLGPDFKGRAPEIAALLKSANADEVKRAINTAGYYSLHTKSGPVQIKPEHFSTSERGLEGDAVLFKHGSASVDTNISKELKDEALVREFERRIQMIRKEMGLKKVDKIELGFSATGETEQVLRANADKISKDINAARGAHKLEEPIAKDVDLEDDTVRVSVKRVER